MTHIQRLERPVSITLPAGDWDIIQGLLNGERNKVRDEGTRPEYLKTLERMRSEIIRKNQ